MRTPSEVFKKILNSKKNIRIKLIGDSVTQGLGGVGFEQDGDSIVEGYARNPNGYCWANLFAAYMKEKYGAEVVNNACCGADIQFVINNFGALVDREDDLIICDIGSNNCPFYYQWGTPPCREEYGKRIYDYIAELYNMFKDNGKEVIFLVSVPICAHREQDGETYVMLLRMADINEIYKKASNNMGFTLINIYENFLTYCEAKNIKLESLYWDGVHPNDRGYDVFFEFLCKELNL